MCNLQSMCNCPCVFWASLLASQLAFQSVVTANSEGKYIHVHYWRQVSTVKSYENKVENIGIYTWTTWKIQQYGPGKKTNEGTLTHKGELISLPPKLNFIKQIDHS